MKALFLFLLMSWSVLSSAQSIPLQNLSQDDFQKVVSDLSANFNHTSVSGASGLGTLFGFEIGLVAGLTQTPNINNVAQTVDPSTSVPRIPHGELLGVLTVPAGITAELGLLPKVGSDSFKFNEFSAAVKWTFTDVLLPLPLSLAVKAQYAKAHIDFSDTVNNVLVNYSYDSTVTDLIFLASKNLMILEPYVGVGIASGKGSLDGNGSTSVFNNSYTTSSTANETRNTTLFMVGTEIKLLMIKFGLEYANLFNTSQYSGKFSVYF